MPGRCCHGTGVDRSAPLLERMSTSVSPPSELGYRAEDRKTGHFTIIFIVFHNVIVFFPSKIKLLVLSKCMYELNVNKDLLKYCSYCTIFGNDSKQLSLYTQVKQC